MSEQTKMQKYIYVRVSKTEKGKSGKKKKGEKNERYCTLGRLYTVGISRTRGTIQVTYCTVQFNFASAAGSSVSGLRILD